jgi:hypothetical protein
MAMNRQSIRQRILSNERSNNKMSLMDGHTLGDLIHAYARARWSRDADVHAATDLGVRLGRELRDRIDVLGMDAERLLTAPPADALSRLEALEKEAMLEDASASSRAAKVGVGGEGRQQNNGKAPMRAPRARPGKNREPLNHRHRRQPG